MPEPPTDLGELWDKQLHFAAYAGFAYALAYATVERESRRLLRGGGVLAIAPAFGFAVEVTQGVLPMRYYSRVDLLANLLGASLVVPWFVLERRIRYVRLRRREPLERDG